MVVGTIVLGEKVHKRSKNIIDYDVYWSVLVHTPDA